MPVRMVAMPAMRNAEFEPRVAAHAMRSCANVSVGASRNAEAERSLDAQRFHQFLAAGLESLISCRRTKRGAACRLAGAM